MFTLEKLSNISELPKLVACPISNWEILTITGVDRISFLQGQLTCDLLNLDTGDQTLGAQCSAHGKICSIFRLFVLEEEVLIILPSNILEKQLLELQKYAIFSKVKIEKSDEYKSIGLAGVDSRRYILDHIDDSEFTKGGHLINNGIIFKQVYPSLRYLILLKNHQFEELLKDLRAKADFFDDELWNAMNISSGLAFIEERVSDKFLPQMLNLQYLDGVSFEKGCYLGQEAVSRAQYRGVNKRSLYILSGHAQSAPKAGDTIQIQQNDHWKKVGTVISGVQYGDKHIELLAVLTNNITHNDIFKVAEIEDSKIYSAPLPYSTEEGHVSDR